MSLHFPQRPSWVCAACALPWPCPPRRAQLMGEFADVGLSALRCRMCVWMADAAQDQPGAFADELLVQFIEWIPRHAAAAERPSLTGARG